MADRQTLAVNKLPQFKEYLIQNGWTIQNTKGKYEVLRAVNQNRKYPLIVYRKDATQNGNALVHLSLMDRDMEIVREFLRNGEKIMKEMVYQKDRKVEVLYNGEYKGYKFAILNKGLYPTAYIENKVGFREFSDADDYADPHGGFTYCGKAYWDKEDLTPYVGWDYGHCNDYVGYFAGDIYAQDLKKWTTQEIFDEVKEVIDALIENTQQIHERTDIEKIVELLSSACQASSKYFREEVKKAFKNGEKYLSRRDGKIKSVLEFQAEALVNAGYGDTKQAVREFAEKLKEYCRKQFEKLETLADISDDAALSLQFIRRRDEYHNMQVQIDKLVKEVCGEC